MLKKITCVIIATIIVIIGALIVCNNDDKTEKENIPQQEEVIQDENNRPEDEVVITDTDKVFINNPEEIEENGCEHSFTYIVTEDGADDSKLKLFNICEKCSYSEFVKYITQE